MPPSIHPDTGKPYVVVGQPLLEVDFGDLPEITDHHIKLLKAAAARPAQGQKGDPDARAHR
ncbi:MAG: hypothetical protein H3C60_15055 [Sphingomonadaceae bacterium]|nr:hypothetical protein [Sphingomonadaceae bacterium]